ncbi:8a6d3b1f-1a05-44a7-a1f0-c165ea314180 [Thermothielavioides terrestris]|uniref:8a6d3b1f-1a05-44a7-a1f0-c165ea314180 n=1 Tax=Thermothielavioides terrestris TaxID=2587410 RepID=A0A446BXI9_9PEZI|nr:8a6d3b1f-1a05-44a7-a1f0-c165ea314180 [Thermothielavioides terrestris]
MAVLLTFYALLILALVGIAIYEHVTIATRSLPVSPALTILAILVPLLSPLTTLTAPLLLHRQAARTRTRKLPPSTTTTTASSTTTLLPAPFTPPLVLHLLQLILTTILLTSLTYPLLSDLDCPLATRWRALFRAHDARAVRAVQDALACCGLRSPRDMAWPFPRAGGAGADACETQFGRHAACLPAWEAVLRRALGGEVGVVAAVAAVQVLAVMMAARGGVWMSRGWGRGWDWGWGHRDGDGEDGDETGPRGSRRPLLTAPAADDDAAARVRVDEEEGEAGRGGGTDDEGEQEVAQRGRGDGYGAIGGGGNGPRVEPAHHDPWAGVERG